MTSARSRKPKLTTAERGYGREHRQERAKWAKVVEAGGGVCTAVVCLEADLATSTRPGRGLEPSRYIGPFDPWHLGHLPDRSGWSGPQHPQCNESEAGIRGNPRTARPPRSVFDMSWSPTQDW